MHPTRIRSGNVASGARNSSPAGAYPVCLQIRAARRSSVKSSQNFWSCADINTTLVVFFLSIGTQQYLCTGGGDGATDIDIIDRYTFRNARIKRRLVWNKIRKMKEKKRTLRDVKSFSDRSYVHTLACAQHITDAGLSGGILGRGWKKTWTMFDMRRVH